MHLTSPCSQTNSSVRSDNHIVKSLSKEELVSGWFTASQLPIESSMHLRSHRNRHSKQKWGIWILSCLWVLTVEHTMNFQGYPELKYLLKEESPSYRKSSFNRLISFQGNYCISLVNRFNNCCNSRRCNTLVTEQKAPKPSRSRSYHIHHNLIQRSIFVSSTLLVYIIIKLWQTNMLPEIRINILNEKSLPRILTNTRRAHLNTSGLGRLQ